MGKHEDLFWEVEEQLIELDLKDKFQTQLLKMKSQEKHQYKSFRDKYEYAFARVTKSPLPYKV